MKNTTLKRRKKHFRAIVGTSLAGASLFQLAMPVLAQLAAGTPIRNTATATYESPGGQQLQTVSNTVEVTVAEVAGISLVSNGVDRLDASGNVIGGAYQPGDKTNFKFILTNTGNDPSKVVIPTPATLNGSPTNVSGGTVTDISYQILKADGTVDTIATAALTDSQISGTGQGDETVSLEPGQQIRLNVKVTVSSTLGSGATVKIALGNVSGPDARNGADTNTDPLNQNAGVQRGTDTNPVDVYTKDNANDAVTGEIDGVPVNLEQEASAFQNITLNVTRTLPFVKLEKTHSDYAPNGTPLNVTDDTLKYNLKLTVKGELPALPGSGGVPGDVTDVNVLYPTFVPGLSTGGTPPLYVLVSDVLPNGTVIDDTAISAITNALPSGWKLVYSTTPTATATGYQATWVLNDTTSITSVNASTITQIGFVYDPASGARTVGTTPTAGNDADVTADFSYTVKLTSAINPGDSIYNIAQVFGEIAEDVDPNTPGTQSPTGSTTPGAFDESGDQSYNNDSNLDGAPDYPADDPRADGIYDGNMGTDPNNNNTGTGDGGEANVFQIATSSGAVLNGTVKANVLRPDAYGPSSQNDDFTNAAAPLTPSTIGAASFSNSLRVDNGNGTPNEQFDVTLTLRPQDMTDLPVGVTIVNIQYNSPTGVIEVQYRVTKTSATSTPTISGPLIPGTNTPTGPIVIRMTEGTDVGYGVTVDLPDDATRNVGYDVPIVAFIDADTDGIADPTEAQNTTIDRVYPGYVTLLKKVQILAANGTPITGARGVLDESTKSIQDGELIRYVVEYKNISESLPTGAPNATEKAYNVTLDATNLVITENGVTGTNNWATDLDGDGDVDTVHFEGTGVLATRNVNSVGTDGQTVGTAVLSTQTYFTNANGAGVTTTPTTNDLIQKYTSALTNNLAPSASGVFVFHRKFTP
jgi:hypothetical protein